MAESDFRVRDYIFQRHQPEKSTLYQLVQKNWLSFKSQVESEGDRSLPKFVVKEFEEYLRCGILAHGFLRTRCGSCCYEHLVAFSCKRRGFCPSCGGRRMSETAAHLIDSVLPLQSYRQWVLSFPVPVRLCLAARPDIMTKALEMANAAISKYYCQKGGLSKKTGSTGAITLIQRFGGSLNLNVHFHQLFLDGCYELGPSGEPLNFKIAPPPTREELQQVLQSIIKRLLRYLEKQGLLIKNEDDAFQLSLLDDPFSHIQASSVSYRFATGPSQGKKAVVIRSLPHEDHKAQSGLVAQSSGFSLHAGVATQAHQRDQLEKLCRYIARPAVAEPRLSVTSTGEVVYKFKRPWDDGTTAIKMSPMELIEKLVALIPRPKVHLTRYHGVLAPHYKYRKYIVPKKTQEPELLLVNQREDEEIRDKTTETGELEQSQKKELPKKKRMSWARLLKRVFHIDVSICPKCRQTMKIIACIEKPEAIQKILDHLHIPSQPPEPNPARGPPLATAIEDYQQESFDI